MYRHLQGWNQPKGDFSSLMKVTPDCNEHRESLSSKSSFFNLKAIDGSFSKADLLAFRFPRWTGSKEAPHNACLLVLIPLAHSLPLSVGRSNRSSQQKLMGG